MDRSLGFVSAANDLIVLLTLAFASAPERFQSLNLAIYRNSLAHHAKGTPLAIPLKRA
jgi:hypothetical protein